MSSNSPSPQDIAVQYHDAFTTGQYEKGLALLAPDVVCSAPPAEIHGADALVQFWTEFGKILRGSRLVASFGEADIAVIVYDTQSVPVESSYAAELLTIEDGLVTFSRMIYDQSPFFAPS